jgi:GntR family transcriptional regulator
MNLALRVDPADAAPIWRQIEQGVQRLVASRALEAGSAVPSVRELSRQLRVNPATVAKAYQRLADLGVLAVRRGEGTFVADAPPPMSAAERRDALAAAAVRYAAVGLTLGADRDEAVAELRSVWSRLGEEPARRDGR